MKTTTINGHIVKLYDSIDELPIVNFQKYNKCVLIDSSLGSDVESVDEHIISLAKYVNAGDRAKTLSELQNMRQNLHLIVSGVSPKYMAFAALVKSIDGVEQKDLSDSGLQAIVDMFSEAPHGFFSDLLAELKKKLSSELEVYFPNEFDSAKEKEAYSQLKRRVALQLSEIAEDVDNSGEIESIDAFLFSLRPPKCFFGKDSEEVKYDKQFESACMVIGQKTGLVAKGMTVLEFYNTMINLQKQAEAEKKAYSKHKR